MESSQTNKELNESEEIVRIVERAKDGAYWKLLEDEIDGRMRFFQSYIDTFSNVGIKNESERLQYNRAVDNIDNLKWFKGINGRLMSKHQGIIEKIKGMTRALYSRVESFVKG